MTEKFIADIKTYRHVLMNRIKTTKIGMRNIKTAISAALCAVIYFLIDRNPTFACIGTVFGMDSSLTASLRTGGNRLAGTVIGGLIGMVFFYVSRVYHLPEIAHITLLFLGIILLVYLSQILCLSGAIQAGSVVYFIVMLNTPDDQYISYALNRMVDTGVGVTLSIFINLLHIKIAGKRNGDTFINNIAK